MGTSAIQEILSVGIDIGTATTQFVVSRLTVKNIAPGSLVPRLAITDKQVIYKSRIYRTPIGDENRVDTQKVFELVQAEFGHAGVTPDQIDTGAVIITGETAKKENARQISAKVAEFAGEFVVATAGGKLESIIAGKGSGAADLSAKNYSTVINVDIGGGTANAGVFRSGKAIDSCCINVGGRLLEIDPASGRVVRVSQPMQEILGDCKIRLVPGDAVSFEVLEKICDRMCTVLLENLGVCAHSDADTMSPLADRLLMTDPLRLDYSMDTLTISGGVADHVYSDLPCTSVKEAARYGDIGPLFGSVLARHLREQNLPLAVPTETMRATVIGAGAQTVDVSGSTILVDEQVLPFKNIPVALPFYEDLPLDAREISRAVLQSIHNFCEPGDYDPIAVGITGTPYYSFKEIQVIARGLVEGTAPLTAQGLPVIVVLEADIGKVLGQSMKVLNPEANIVCVDQLVVTEGDYVDIGWPMYNGTVVPVIIKSLVFETRQL